MSHQFYYLRCDNFIVNYIEHYCIDLFNYILALKVYESITKLSVIVYECISQLQN